MIPDETLAVWIGKDCNQSFYYDENDNFVVGFDTLSRIADFWENIAYDVYLYIGGVYHKHKYTWNDSTIGFVFIPNGNFNSNSPRIDVTTTIQFSKITGDSEDIETLLRSWNDATDEVYIYPEGTPPPSPPSPDPTKPTLLSVNGEELQIQAKPRLIFAANSIENRGRSHKSYSILLPRNTHNNAILGGVFDRMYNRIIRFAALYAYETEILEGYLVIVEITKRHARALFISGNGSLWDKLADKKLNSGFDWSAYDEELTYSNSSKATLQAVMYDLSDRGAFINGDSIDLSERYPAVQIGTLLKEIFNQSGVGLTWNLPTAYDGMIQEQAFLLFTQDTAFRNDEDWARTAPYAAGYSGGTYERYGEGIELNAQWEILLELNKILDEGGNYSNVPNYSYTVPETGTYRIKLEIASFSVEFQDNAGGVFKQSAYQLRDKKKRHSITP